MIDSNTDYQKARTMLYYLGQGLQKLQHREEQKEKLHVVLKQLKSINTEEVKHEIQKVQDQLNELIEKENRITKQQGKEEHLHKNITNKISVLENKLGRYIKHRHKKVLRRKELEEKVRKMHQISIKFVIKDRLEALEEKLNELKGKEDKKKLKELQAKIIQLKRKIKV